MSTIVPFTRGKFLEGKLTWQHKKCAELLKKIYEELREKKTFSLLAYYHQITSWINVAPLDALDIESISTRYHWHLHMAKLSLKEHNLLPPIRTQDQIAKEDFLPHCIYLNDVRSAYNVGSILRTAEALRIGEVCFSPRTPFIDHDQVIKTAMGAEKHVPCRQISSLETLPRPFIGLDTSDEAISLENFLFPFEKPFTLFLGNEEFGLAKEVLKELDYLVEIPMLGIKNSLNVACAFAITAFEIKRQASFKASAILS